jgi:hypothetical protein
MQESFQFFKAELVITDELGDPPGRGALEIAFYQLVDALFAVFGLADPGPVEIRDFLFKILFPPNK